MAPICCVIPPASPSWTCVWRSYEKATNWDWYFGMKEDKNTISKKLATHFLYIHNSDPRLKFQERGDICAPSSTIRLSPLFIKKLLCTLESWPWRWPAEKNKKLPTLHLTKEEAKNKEFFKAGKGGNYNITQNPWDTLQIFQKTGSTFLPMIPFGQPVKKPITHFPSQISIS